MINIINMAALNRHDYFVAKFMQSFIFKSSSNMEQVTAETMEKYMELAITSAGLLETKLEIKRLEKTQTKIKLP
jgi:hypothetical protein